MKKNIRVSVWVGDRESVGWQLRKDAVGGLEIGRATGEVR